MSIAISLPNSKESIQNFRDQSANVVRYYNIPVPTASLFGNIDILYLLSHGNSVLLSMGRIESKYVWFIKRIGTCDWVIIF